VAENSLLRVLDSDLNLISAPISFFDDQLMSYAKTRQLKSARIIGEVLASFWPERRYQTCDGFLASRVRALVAAGRLEGFGDLWQIQASEVRLLQSSAGCDET
jgi:hypothetical protein